eukprot:9493375-Pyramimonas_sp.AAC.1
MHGTVSGVRQAQIVLRAELHGFLNVLRHVAAPPQVGIDDSTVVRGLRGPVLCPARRPHADLWHKIWNAIEDSFVGEGVLVVVKVEAHSKKIHAQQLEGLELC